MKIRIFGFFLCLVLIFTGCGENGVGDDITDTEGVDIQTENSKNTENQTNETETQGEVADLGDDDKTFGEDIEDAGIYDGYFEGESKDFTVECVSGTKNACRLEGTTLTFTTVSAETTYSISGTFHGNIVIDTGDNFKFDLELNGFSLKSSEINPIIVLSGSEVAIQAKKDTINYIYDNREAIDETNTDLYSGAIHSLVDLEIGGKGKLEVESKNNNGIHSKDDLQVKNLTLSVSCIDNALKGNDSVEITDATITLISKQGDGIKTINSDVSSKGNQRGTISINGGTINIYAACDGIDAAYNVVIDNEETKLNIYTDKYSNYSEEVTDTKEGTYYVRFSSSTYKYSIKYYNSDSDYEWVDATYSTPNSQSRHPLF